MRAFLTGATGFVGGHLARALLDDGFDVRCLAREAARLGFKRVLLPAQNLPLTDAPSSIETVGIHTLEEGLHLLF